MEGKSERQRLKTAETKGISGEKENSEGGGNEREVKSSEEGRKGKEEKVIDGKLEGNTKQSLKERTKSKGIELKISKCKTGKEDVLATF